MCDYCEGEKPLYDLEVDIHNSYYSRIWKENEHYCVFNSVENDFTEYCFEFDINYCPVCGKKLGGE